MSRGDRWVPRLPAAEDAADHPFFRGPLSRWTARVLAERVTLEGRWYLFVAAAFLHFTVCSLEIQSYLPLMFALGVWLVAGLLEPLMRPRVRLQARHAPRVSAGESLTVGLEIVANPRLIAHQAPLRIIPHRLPTGWTVDPPDGVSWDCGAAAVDADGRATGRLRIGIRPQKRGVYRLSGYRVDNLLPMGIFRAVQVVSRPEHLTVTPRFAPITSLDVPIGRRWQPGGVALAASRGDTREYAGSREYRPGDSIRDMDWRATARLSTAIIREYREEYFLRAAVVLDTGVGRRPSAAGTEAFEDAVSLTAALVDYLEREDYLVDLFAAGPDVHLLTAGRGLAHLDQVLDLLACVEAQRHVAAGRLLEGLGPHLRELTAVLCVFLNWDEERAGFIRALVDAGVAVRAYVVRAEPLALDPRSTGDPIVAGSVRLVDPAQVRAGIASV